MDFPEFRAAIEKRDQLGNEIKENRIRVQQLETDIRAFMNNHGELAQAILEGKYDDSRQDHSLMSEIDKLKQKERPLQIALQRQSAEVEQLRSKFSAELYLAREAEHKKLIHEFALSAISFAQAWKAIERFGAEVSNAGVFGFNPFLRIPSPITGCHLLAGAEDAKAFLRQCINDGVLKAGEVPKELA